MNKVLGLDLGRKTLGIAISDVLGIAHPYKLIRFKKDDYQSLIEPIREIIKENNIKEVVLGLPLHLNGQQSEMSKTCLEFKQLLLNQIANIYVEMVDERLTSVSAHKILTNLNMDSKKQKDYVDMVAASNILETYLRKKENNHD